MDLRLPALLAGIFFTASVARAQLALDVWHTEGQTWIVWTDNLVFTGAESWSVYRASAPIVDLAQAELVGRAFPQDVHAATLKASNPLATWTVPAAGGAGARTLAANEALFVYTPRAVASEYFAVVKTGQTALGPANTFGPVAQTTAPVSAHAQLTGVDATHPYTVYSLWIDGDADLDAGRADFPVLGNASQRGLARLFCVFEPSAGLPPAPIPMLGFLHGGDGGYWTYRPSQSNAHQIDAHPTSGLYVTFDDSVWIRPAPPQLDAPYEFRTRWFGFVDSYDRFQPASITPPPTAVVQDTTPRTIDWILDWLVAARGVDSARIAMAGLSMGGRGTTVYVRSRPDRVSSAIAYVPPAIQDVQIGWDAMFGAPGQDLATSLGASFGVVMTLDTPLSALDLPFLRIVSGTSDDSVEWVGIPAAYRGMDAQGWGAHLYWDEREHTNNNNGWIGAHFNGSPKLHPPSLASFRNDRSYPAFFSVDHGTTTAGQQPDPGDDVLPANGSPWGTWGGFFEWSDATLVDTTALWSAQVWVVSSSSFPNDLPPATTAWCSIGPRRAQAFAPPPCTDVDWSLVRVSDGVVLDSGVTTVRADGRVDVAGLALSTTVTRLELRPSAALVDCNANSIADACDIENGTSTDANADRVPDECQPATGPFCAGDGLGASPATPCPCGNFGAAGRGCASSVNANGALLTASGAAATDNVVLAASGMPATSTCIYLQGDGLADTTFGDGVRCTGGALLRLRIRANTGGASAFPDATDTITLSARGGVVPGSGAVRRYQTYYRNAAALFCPPETFNVTNGWWVTW